MPRVVAISDPHLGRSHYHAVNEQGVNQREADVAAAWHRATAAALDLNPDAVLLLGDLFDAPRPTYRAFREGLRGLRRLDEAGVPALAISGNHDTPRLRESGSPYGALADTLPRLRFVYRGALESVDVLPGLRVHAVPQCRDDEELRVTLAEAAAARSADHHNVLVTHAAVTLLSRRYSYGDINELQVDAGALDPGFDRILLGHFHNFSQVAPNAWYPGATETFHFGDLPKDGEPPVKGVASLDTVTGAVQHHQVPGGRALRSYTVDAFGLGADEIYRQTAEVAAGDDHAGAVVRVFVNKARPEVRRLVDRRVMADAFPGALHVQVNVEALAAEGAAQSAPQPLDSLAGEWDRYVAAVPVEGYDRDRLVRLGREYLEQVEEGGR